MPVNSTQPFNRRSQKKPFSPGWRFEQKVTKYYLTTQDVGKAIVFKCPFREKARFHNTVDTLRQIMVICSWNRKKKNQQPPKLHKTDVDCPATVCVWSCVHGALWDIHAAVRGWVLSEYPDIDRQRHLRFPYLGLLLWSNTVGLPSG